MTAELWVALIGAIAWPAVTLSLAMLFKGPIAALIGRVKKATGPGGSGAEFFDPIPPPKEQIQRIVEEEIAAPQAPQRIAERIRAEAFPDKRESRLLLALVDEEAGRHLQVYRDSPYYGAALQRLVEKGQVRQDAQGYHLTEAGQQAIKPLLARLLAQYPDP